MLRNYIKVALRNIRKNKLYAFLNMMGLSIGLASFFIIYLFLQNENAYDRFHPKADRIYRVLEEITTDTGVEVHGETTSALAPVATEEIPEIEAFSRISLWPKGIKIEDAVDSVLFLETLAVDAGLLDFFGLNFLSGDPETALDSPDALLLNETRARQLFGSVDALGQTLMVEGIPLIVSGVFKDLPSANSLKAELIVHLPTINPWRKDQLTAWNANYGDQTYFLLTEGANVEIIEDKLNKLYSSNLGLEDRNLQLQPLVDVHFSVEIKDAIKEKSDSDYILVFTLVAGFILICSVFNYISLALSQSVERVKEIGIRKVVGAARKQLLWQFVTESVVHVLAGYIMALIIVELLTPELEVLIERKLSFDLWLHPALILQGLGFSIAVALLSAVYPALFVTKLKVISILRRSVSGLSTHRMLNAISVFQLVVFIVLISAAFTANRQLLFLQNENLGFDKEEVMVIGLYTPEAINKQEALKNELLRINTVSSVSHTRSIPSRVMGFNVFADYGFRFYNFHVDEDYFKTMGMTIVEGRGFLPEDANTTDLVIVNETAARKLNFEGGAVGKTVKTGNKELRIIGVVKDFHFGTKKEPIEATLFNPIDNDWGLLAVKFEGSDFKRTVADVKATYDEVTGGEKLSLSFLEDAINAQYKQENIMIKVINSFTAMAAIVAFIGLFGISGYAVKRRLKEMGIRKILGANFVSIQKSLNSANLVKMGVAIAIALPLIVYWMNSWLQSFAYRIDFPVALVVFAFFLAVMVVFITVSIHSIRAYLINPVEILKDE